MINVNLLPDSKLKGVKQNRSKQVVLSISSLVIITSIVLPVGMFVSDFLLQKVISSRQEKIDKLVAEFEAQDDVQRILTVQSHLDSISEVEGNRYFMSNLLAVIEHATPESASFLSLTAINEDGTFEFRASANTIADANAFIDTLEAITVQGGDEETSSDVFAFTSPLARTFSQDDTQPVQFTVNGKLNAQIGEIENIKEFVLQPIKLERELDKGRVIPNQSGGQQ